MRLAEDVKKKTEDFAAWIQKTYPDESSGKASKNHEIRKVSQRIFIAAMERRCMCCLMSIKGT